jgi:hypothetical protein
VAWSPPSLCPSIPTTVPASATRQCTAATNSKHTHAAAATPTDCTVRATALRTTETQTAKKNKKGDNHNINSIDENNLRSN